MSFCSRNRKKENAGFNSNCRPLIRLFRCVIFVVLLELSFLVEKQFLEHPTPPGSGPRPL